MQATLMPSVIGQHPLAPTGNAAREEHGQFAVYDMELKDWRSFLIERVSTVITPSLGEIKTDGTDRLV